MNLLRAAATVSGLTLLSRLTGLARENLTASIFGAPALTDVLPATGFTPDELLRLVAAVEALSEHPLATAIVIGAQ